MSESSVPFFNIARERALDYRLVLFIADSLGAPGSGRKKRFRAPDEFWKIELDHVQAIKLAVKNEKKRRRKVVKQ